MKQAVKKEERILMGNEAIARGLVENSCSLAASYPGTPASEILSSLVAFSKEAGVRMHLEWSVNEKVAYEVALANSYTGKRSAVAMKQVGLNVAADPFTRSAYLGTIGGLVVIVADDPGPHSSQTEQDSRLFAQFANIPVLDPSSPREARDMVGAAFRLSEKYEIPVMLRPTTRVCHARQNVALNEPERIERRPNFVKNPGRWIATPQFLTGLHRTLNEKLEKIAADEDCQPACIKGNGKRRGTAIIASGVSFAHAYDILADMGILGDLDLYQVVLPYPLSRSFAERIRTDYDQVLVLEETHPVIELQLAAPAVNGRRDGFVPNEGELTPDVVQDVISRFAGAKVTAVEVPGAKGRRPSLCPGCPHRAAYYAVKSVFPNGIFPSDIGCYTLGMNLGAIDTCHCMGACISQGAGFYFAHAGEPQAPPIVASIGDSTFFHAGIPALVNAVFQKARFIVLILDNATTAMTGSQPTPQTGFTADGGRGNQVSIAELVRACGVKFLRECDPYDFETFCACLKEADGHCRRGDGGMAVVIAKHPCILDRDALRSQKRFAMTITEDCTGCGECVENFECAALVMDGGAGRVKIDHNVCIGCGVCTHVCPFEAITASGIKKDSR